MKNRDSLEVSSESLKSELEHIGNELQEVKERLTTLESIHVHVNRDELFSMVESTLADSDERRRIVIACAEPKTKEELVELLNLKSTQSLDYKMKPLRIEHTLIEETRKDGKVAFIQSRLFQKLSKKDQLALLKLNKP